MLRGLATLLLLTSSAAAQTARLELAGDACDLSELRTKVSETDRRLRIDDSASVVVRVSTSAGADGGTFVGDVALDDDHRSVTATSCAELVDALALIIAMALPAPSRAAEVSTVVTDDVPPVVARPARFTRLIAGASGGPTREGWTSYALFGVEWGRGMRSLGVEGRISSPDREMVGGDASIRVWESAVSGVPCIRFGGFAACTPIGAGFVRGTQSGLADARDATSPSLFVGGRLQWTVPVSPRVFVRFQIDGDVRLTTTRFDVDHMPVWTSDRLNTRGGIDVLAHFP